MAREMMFYFDKTEDILDISVDKPKKAISTEVMDDFFVRRDVKSKKIVGFTILNFEKWFRSKRDERSIPLSAEFRLVS